MARRYPTDTGFRTPDAGDGALLVRSTLCVVEESTVAFFVRRLPATETDVRKWGGPRNSPIKFIRLHYLRGGDWRPPKIFGDASAGVLGERIYTHSMEFESAPPDATALRLRYDLFGSAFEETLALSDR